jgi:four helix bundle protein
VRFEDLEAWKLARILTRDIYQMTKDSELARDFRLSSQVQAASVSIMSNIAEGFERTGIQEKIHFYNIARASCGEVRSQLYVIEDVYGIEPETTQALRDQVVRTGQLLTGLIKSTENRK